ncbi:MAG: agmatine deiminase family protein [Campylobacterota bacterium]|nr:agmatine deiminase family protein [Campylobacterota bacterium]
MRHYNRYPAEFEEQSFIQIIFPHKQSDWIEYLEEAQENFIAIIEAIRRFEPCLIICDNVLHVKSFFSNHKNLSFIEYQTDDTWARDCSTISVIEDGEVQLLDFTFNAWGGKFDASRDNAMNAAISPCKSIDFVLEGGAIESNGEGTLLTTSQCLKNPNRNPNSNVDKILKELLHVKKIIYLHHGYLAGDDTDSHIDTLARFISEDTIMYLTCKDKDDEHYKALYAMQEELRATPYKLIALPMTEAIYYDGKRLPATYANFLMINGAVLVPTYNDIHDDEAIEIFKKSFPNREILAIDCSILIRQHGSLHCVTMHYPKIIL